MKIGILTLPLHTNYGGNLQAFALMRCLKDMGHDVWLINRRSDDLPAWKLPLRMGKRMLQKYLLGKRDLVINLGAEQRLLGKNTQKFIDRNIQPQTEPFYSTQALIKNIGKYQFDAVIVGSDQVWRPGYTSNIEDFFFGFLNQSKTKRISYAASFGTSEWTFDEQQTKRCAELVQRFDAVSVREDTGVELCKKHFGIQAEHVIDPTMLVDVSKYLDLFVKVKSRTSGLLVYMLDETEDKVKVIEKIEGTFKLDAFRVNAKTEDHSLPVSERIAPPTEEWLRGFYEAEYVITDSFHACVFAILFNKPFLAYGNEGRGLARFKSLLDMFGLEERLITSSEMLTDDLLYRQLNWTHIEQLLEQQKEKALTFLKNALQD